ncbi:hypothetical protein B0J14DRAFT_569917 [Halenospora varia]|nr:hypothetical protein B0J14DRAFT_569917 [Halenospora varia]
MTTVGICGGDLHVYHGSFGSSTLPCVLGQEGTCIVEFIGSGVQHLRVGDHVVIPDIFNIGEINMGIVEPEVQLGTSLGWLSVPVGLLATYSALLRGASRVYVVDHIPKRLQLVPMSTPTEARNMSVIQLLLDHEANTNAPPGRT